MSAKFEYRVCMIQEGRITWVNGEWQGKLPINKTNSTGALQSCPHTWDYLALAGAEGWEMIAATPSTLPHGEYEAVQTTMFLKRTL